MEQSIGIVRTRPRRAQTASLRDAGMAVLRIARSVGAALSAPARVPDAAYHDIEMAHLRLLKGD